MNGMAIVADDLTGASDTGVQFARKGFLTQVILNAQSLSQDFDKERITVIDTDSRALSRTDAYRQVKAVADTLKLAGCAHIYKKIDSTLRGNIGVEIDALMDVLPFDFAVIVPAFPVMGRTTVGGVHRLKGVPVHLTELAADPKCPVHESDIMKLLGAQSERKIELVPLETVRLGGSEVRRQIESNLQQEIQLFVCDAETDDDMATLVDVVKAFKSNVLWVGSAGLAEVLSKGMDISAPADSRIKEHIIEQSDEPVMLVAGSLSPVTREQVEGYCQEQGVAGIELNPKMLVNGHAAAVEEVERCSLAIHDAIRDGFDIALYVASMSVRHPSIPQLIAEALGETAANVCAANRFAGLILTGGDTAKAVCRHLGISSVELVCELEPGVPLGKSEGEQKRWLVTKAGAFGTQQTLIHARHVLKRGL